MMPRIVVDENIPLVREFFSTLGEVIPVAPREISPAHLKNAELLVVRSVVPITKTLLQGSALKFVGTCTAGTDHLDTDYLQAQNIRWTGAPGCNANAVVEYVFSVLARLAIPWRRGSVGIVGCGNVGGLLYRRLTAFGVECRCYDPFLNPSQQRDLYSLEAVLQSNIVCIHAPLTTAGPYPTKHMVGGEQLQQLRAGAVLINAGRGSVIDGEALLHALTTRDDLTVALDVWEHEPHISRALFKRVNLGTPHIAGHSYDGKINGTEIIYRKACEFLGEQPTLSLTNFDKHPLQRHTVGASSGEDILREAILHAYDAGADHWRFAEQLQQNDNTGAVFDAFRKHYPIRREFHKHLIELRQYSSDCADQLKQLGFIVAETCSSE